MIFWRFEYDDFKNIFSDMDISILAKDNDEKLDGIFIKAKKPIQFQENNIDDYFCYSVIKRKRACKITNREIIQFNILYNIRKRLSKNFLNQYFLKQKGLPYRIMAFLKNRLPKFYLLLYGKKRVLCQK